MAGVESVRQKLIAIDIVWILAFTFDELRSYRRACGEHVESV